MWRPLLYKHKPTPSISAWPLPSLTLPITPPLWTITWWPKWISLFAYPSSGAPTHDTFSSATINVVSSLWAYTRINYSGSRLGDGTVGYTRGHTVNASHLSTRKVKWSPCLHLQRMENRQPNVTTWNVNAAWSHIHSLRYPSSRFIFSHQAPAIDQCLPGQTWSLYLAQGWGGYSRQDHPSLLYKNYMAIEKDT